MILPRCKIKAGMLLLGFRMHTPSTYSIYKINTLSNCKSEYFNAKTQLVEFVAIISVLKWILF